MSATEGEYHCSSDVTFKGKKQIHTPTVIKGEGERGEAKLARNLLFHGLKFRSSVCVGITSFFLLLVLLCS